MRAKNILKEIETKNLKNIFSAMLLVVFLGMSNNILALSLEPLRMINPFWELIQSMFKKSAIIFVVTLVLGIIDFIRVKISLKKNKEDVKKFYKKFFLGALIFLVITLIAFTLIMTDIIPQSVEANILYGESLGIISIVAAIVFLVTLILGMIDFIRGKNKENVKKRYEKFFLVALISLYIFVIIFFR